MREIVVTIQIERQHFILNGDYPAFCSLAPQNTRSSRWSPHARLAGGLLRSLRGALPEMQRLSPFCLARLQIGRRIVSEGGAMGSRFVTVGKQQISSRVSSPRSRSGVI